jgi:hypothetical protein
VFSFLGQTVIQRLQREDSLPEGAELWDISEKLANKQNLPCNEKTNFLQMKATHRRLCAIEIQSF